VAICYEVKLLVYQYSEVKGTNFVNVASHDSSSILATTLQLSKVQAENLVFETVILWLKIYIITIQIGDTLLVAQLVEALRYKLEGRGFDFRWCHWNFLLT
jgi:hypothetical protein